MDKEIRMNVRRMKEWRIKGRLIQGRRMHE
jgi:hypothetical protein